MGELLTEDQLAAQWNTTARHLRWLRAEAGLPFVKLGRLVRYDLDDVAEWVKARKVGPPPPPARPSRRRASRSAA